MRTRTLLCAIVIGVFAFSGTNSGTPQQKGDPAKKAAQVDDLAKLGKARRDAAEKAYKAWASELNTPFGVIHYQLSVGWLNADLDLAKKKEDRIVAYRSHVRRMKDWEEDTKVRVRPGNLMFPVIAAFQREADFWLAKEQATIK
ncbi:MAG: hypothetical protein HYX68_19155 [Planctomycetes bacterium]|nr:hypothetical protein [Planctomycetota bacterium]